MGFGFSTETYVWGHVAEPDHIGELVWGERVYGHKVVVRILLTIGGDEADVFLAMVVLSKAVIL